MQQSPEEHAQELIDTFDILGEWDERYRFLIDLGRELPAMDELDKTDVSKVKGCLSSVWLVAGVTELDGEKVIEFIADSDSAIVKGLVAMLRKIYSGQSPRDIVAFDIEAMFQQLDLGQHLSMGRRNGLSEMVQRVKVLATQLAQSTPE
ncbi:MAG: sulfur transfer protein SufE [Parasphingorhabdus sp.]|jgi:sulfur transfer protein SufE